MFSGIVEEVGVVESYDGVRLSIRAERVLRGLCVSDSVLVSGACLTVVERGDGCFAVETVPETVRRTNLGCLEAGDGVNLERALAYGGRVGGHLVQGHVDGVGELEGLVEEGVSTRVLVRAPANIMRYAVSKGFISVDGISLTVAGLWESGFWVAIVPYTRENTTIGGRKAGDSVNLEVDVIAKYVERFAGAYPGFMRAEERAEEGAGDSAGEGG